MRTFRCEAVLVGLALLAAGAACAQNGPESQYRVQGELRRGPDGKLILVPPAAPPAPAQPAAPARPPAPAHAPAAAAPSAAAPPPPPSRAAQVPVAAAKTPAELDRVSCEAVSWQPGTSLEACLAALRAARARSGS